MILVAGSTGSLGGRIVRELLDDGEAVRALARPGSNHAPLEAAGAEVALGDLKDPVSLRRACDGVDALITTASMSKRGDDTPENVDLRGNVNLFDAARAAGVAHVVFVSTIGASPDSRMSVFRAKGVAEDALRESGMAYTILQLTPLMDVWFPVFVEAPIVSGRPVTLVGQSRGRHSFLAERDAAAFAIAALRRPAAHNATVMVGGPQAVTIPDVVHAYEEATGRLIPMRSVNPGEPIPGVPEPVAAFAAALERREIIVPMEATAAGFGVSQTSVRDFARVRLATVIAT